MFEFCRRLLGTGSYGIGTGLTGGLIMFVGLAALGVLIYFIVKNSQKNRYGSNAHMILDERLAKGDIDEETYYRLSEKIR